METIREITIAEYINPLNSSKVRLSSWKFSGNIADSEILHHVLCEFDPGADYDVKFRTILADVIPLTLNDSIHN